MEPIATGNRHSQALTRQANLDLLRAIAILAVVFFYGIHSAPTHIGWLSSIATNGRHGVDLFFVLSGWLIGSLYWREAAAFGNVDVRRFLLRRWLRTIPPYLAGLLLAWCAVRVARAEPFDFGYLLFVQNYYGSMPFFFVSWSLCVEEHFYLFVPLVLAVLPRSRRLYAWLVAALVFAAPVGRFILSSALDDPTIGFANTATHLHMEGLLLGFFAAMLPTYPSVWARIIQISRALFIPSLVALFGLTLLPKSWMYGGGLTVLAFALLVVLVYVVQRQDYRLAKTRAIQWLALSSYSIYLTHALMIHVSQLVVKRFPALPEITYYVLAVGGIAGLGAAFYFAVERTSILLRDRVAPRRSRTIPVANIANTRPRSSNSRPPVVVLGAARSGTKLLRGLVASTGQFAEVPFDVNYIWRYGNEALPHDAISPDQLNWRTSRFIREWLAQYAGQPSFVEKTVSNILRVPFVKAVFPEAKFVAIIRDGRDVVESAERCWREPPRAGYVLTKLRTFPWRHCAPYGRKYAMRVLRRRLGIDKHLGSWGPRYPGIDDDLRSRSLLEVCARQWTACMEHFERSLPAFAPNQLLVIRYENLVHDPHGQTDRLCDFLGLDDRGLAHQYAAQVIRSDRLFSSRCLNTMESQKVLNTIAPTLERWGYDVRFARAA